MKRYLLVLLSAVLITLLTYVVKQEKQGPKEKDYEEAIYKNTNSSSIYLYSIGFSHYIDESGVLRAKPVNDTDDCELIYLK